MSIIQAIILGLVQGFTEFLPVSSSGHLVIFQELFGLQKGMLTFDICVHLATLIPVIYLFRKDIFDIIKNPFCKLSMMLVVGTVPAIVIGVAFNKLFERLFESGITIGFEFLLTGLILLYAENVKKRDKKIEKTTFTDAAMIGIAQGIAILPAVSRSGLTIAGALWRGLNREFAAKFSFLLSIPAILGAAAFDGYKLTKISNVDLKLLPTLSGMLVAALSGYIAIRFMLKIISKGSLKIFSIYVFLVGTSIIIEQIFSGKYFGKLF